MIRFQFHLRPEAGLRLEYIAVRIRPPAAPLSENFSRPVTTGGTLQSFRKVKLPCEGLARQDCWEGLGA